MITRIRKSLDEKEQGFTLIELLVVVIIIGILAAIAIPAFLNQRRNGWAAQVESDLRNAAIIAESYSVTQNGSYAGLTTQGLRDNGYNATTGVILEVGTPAPTVDTFTLTARHTNLGTDQWTYSSTTGRITQPGGSTTDPDD